MSHEVGPSSGEDAPTSAPSPARDDRRLPLEAPPSRLYWANLHRPLFAGFALTLGGILAVAVALAAWNLSTVLVYIVSALFAALGLDPLVRMLERRGLARGWAIGAVSAAMALVVAALAWLVLRPLVDQVAQFVASLPALIDDFRRSSTYAWILEHFSDQAAALIDEAQAFVSEPANLAAVGGGVIRVGLTVGSIASGIVIVLVLAIYFLASLSGMQRAFTRFFPARDRERTAATVRDICSSVGGYLGGMVILAACNALLVLVLHALLGLPFPLLMAVAAFSITLIPLVGTVVFWIVGSTLALLSSPSDALIFALVYLVYMQVEAYLLTPRVMHRTIAVPGVLVVIGALVGGTLLGLLGALVAIPVTAAILLILERSVLPRQDAKT